MTARFPIPFDLYVRFSRMQLTDGVSEHGEAAFGEQIVLMSLCRPWSWNQMRVHWSAWPARRLRPRS